MQKLLSLLVLTLLVTNCIADGTSPKEIGSSSPASTSSSDPESSSKQTKTTVSSTSAIPTTTVKYTTSSPSPSPTTTEAPETTSTATTTAATTSVAPNTTVETTSPEPTTTQTSTTDLPTTSSPVPSTTVAPPKTEEGNWTVTSGNTTCIRAVLNVLFTIQLEDKVKYIALSPNASSEDSNCNAAGNTQELVLTDSDYILKFIFEEDSANVYVRNISFTYILPDITETVTNDTHLFSVKKGNSYLCAAHTNVVLGNVTMEIYKIHIQAFGEVRNKDFGTVEECDADNPVNDIVPIAVGVALLALVVVVLIAYLVGRRRSRQKGYQSM